MPAPQAVLFDLGGTLMEWHPGLVPEQILGTVAPAALRLLPKEKAGLVTAKALATVVRRTYLELEQAACDGDTSPMPIELCVRRGLAGLGVTVDSATADAIIGALYVSEKQTSRLLPFALEALEALSAAGFRMGIISNRMHGGASLQDDLAYFGIARFFSCAVTSAEVGQMKPHPALFRLALERLEVQPEEAVMVGDDLCCDIGGALSSGLRAVWMRRPPERADEPPAGVPSIKSLEQLQAAIERLR